MQHQNNETRIVCSQCVMDKSAPEITFDDSDGVCNFCHQAQKSLKEIREDKRTLHDAIWEMTDPKKKSEYDCLIGLSGGVDSSYLLTQGS